jgi:hypothetical protein
MSYKKKLLHAKLAEAAEAARVAMGAHMVGALADNTHRQTGLLANSHNYRTPEQQGPFGNGPVKDAKEELGVDNQASQPPKDTVRVSSALSYSIPYNNRFKLYENTIDVESKQLKPICEAAYKRIIGT